MRVLVLAILFYSFIISSCSKDKDPFVVKPESSTTNDSTPSVPPTVIHQDSIYYTDIPDTAIHSVLGWNSGTPTGCIPIPSDTTITFYLDLDQDGTNDFAVSSETYYTMVGGSNYCQRHRYGTYIEPTNVTDSVSVIIGQYFNCDTINSGGLINEGRYFWGNRAWFYAGIMQIASYYPFYDFYIGVKMKRNAKVMFGWIRVQIPAYDSRIIIKDFALNKTNGNDISAGQTQ